ncbi:MAG: TPM domain-containing protein [Bacteroidota bacterium]|nr:TPM domain-containing protein [Bacteroidota bacterium]
MQKTIVILLVFLNGIIFSQVPERPRPQKLYNNLSNEQPSFLNEQEVNLVETRLETFSNETSNQICVVITDDLKGLSDEQYATAIGQQWGVGKKDKNNGVVILIKPTGGQGKRKLFIAVGYGLEGAIPDLATKKIREKMYPFLKSGENYKALDAALTDLMGLAKGEINVKDYSSESLGSHIFNFVVIIFLIILLIRIFFGKGGGGGHTYSGGSSSGWTGSSSSSSSSSSWGGFGGGSFGGGGSGGDW